MFKIAKLAVKMTNVKLNTVKNIAKNKINLQNASDSFRTMAETQLKKTPYQTNAFKRAITWVKEFAANFKEIFDRIKAPIANLKKTLGKTFGIKHQKNTADMIVDNIRTNSGIDKMAKELNELLKVK